MADPGDGGRRSRRGSAAAAAPRRGGGVGQNAALGGARGWAIRTCAALRSAIFFPPRRPWRSAVAVLVPDDDAKDRFLAVGATILSGPALATLGLLCRCHVWQLLPDVVADRAGRRDLERPTGQPHRRRTAGPADGQELRRRTPRGARGRVTAVPPDAGFDRWRDPQRPPRGD